jgi:bifunctional polynucleotide phosphatase/kinase
MPIIEKNLIYKLNMRHNKGRIAAFDLDYTLVKTKSGNRFPKDKDDWVFYNDNIKKKLQEYDQFKYDIVIFTNQKPLGKSKIKQDNFLEKLNNIQHQLGVKFSYFVSMGSGYYRKPSTGPFDVLIENMNCKIDFKKSFYCGDAAERPVGWSWTEKRNGKKIKSVRKKKDFSGSDMFFASNCGLKFYVAEQLFTDLLLLDPIKLPERKFLDTSKKNENTFQVSDLSNKKPNLIIMTGLPASGKSYLANKIKDDSRIDFNVLNLDTIKNKKKLQKTFLDLVKNKENIIIDNTNVQEVDRKYYLDNQTGYHTISIHVTTSIELINHLNYFRAQHTKNDKTYISSIVYNIMKKKFTKPAKKEGFDKIFSQVIELDIDKSDTEKYKQFMYYY